MSSEKLPRPTTPDAATWYAAVRYGVAQELRKRLEPAESVPHRFRELVVALQQAEQGRKTNPHRLASETASGSGA